MRRDPSADCFAAARRHECHRCRRVNRRNCTAELIETPVAKCVRARTNNWSVRGITIDRSRLFSPLLVRVFLHLETRNERISTLWREERRKEEDVK